MRRSLVRIPYRATTSAFSTSSAGGSGRGRGATSPFQFTATTPSGDEPDNSPAPPPPHGHGRGRGAPLPPPPARPSFSFVNNADPNAPSLGRGRGFTPASPPPPPSEKPSAKTPSTLSLKDEEEEEAQTDKQEKIIPTDIINVLSGAGRGKPGKPPSPQAEKPKQENRHIRPRPRSPAADMNAGRGGDGVRGGGRGRGGRGRGRGRGDERGTFRGRENYNDEDSDDEDREMDLHESAEAEKFAEKLGPEVMNKLAEGIEEMSSRVLPDPEHDAVLEAYELNMKFECEPEYMMDFDNPDIDEKPPIPLRDALEKCKPFLMAYEGIQSQEEWEEIIEETMQNAPLIKEIVDYYGGPDRATAKQQQEELERVAKTLPASAPASVKRFTERAVLSLQSNPGWGFDKKCQFMDKVIMEVSQQYK